jgi:DNA-directed RNA polymerase subunit RPC12/RpoP
MGQGITIECKSCKYRETFILGVGMGYFSLENVINLVSVNHKNEILNILHNENINDIDYQHKLFMCPHCHKLASRFDYLIQYNINKKLSPIFHCPECKTQMISVIEPIENIPCPECGEKSLTKSFSMLWD